MEKSLVAVLEVSFAAVVAFAGLELEIALSVVAVALFGKGE